MSTEFSNSAHLPTASGEASTTGAPGIRGQLAVVTGGARGLGAAISRALLDNGAKVVINYFSSAEAAEQIAEQYPDQAFAVGADVRDPAAVQRLFAQAKEHFGEPVTTVVHNALVDFAFNGDARPKAHEITYSAFTAQLDGALGGALNVIHAALEGMHEAGGGRIITIGTNLFQHPVVPHHDYTAAKAALLSLTRTFADDLGPKGIRVNMVSGGLLRSTDASAATPEEVFDEIAAATPLREVTTPEQLADAVLFFASEWSRGVTGQNLVVDGGLVKG